MADGLLRPSQHSTRDRKTGDPKRVYAPITTDKQVQSLKESGARYERTCDYPKGLVVCVTPGTGPAFYLRYVSRDGNRRRLRLGAYDRQSFGLAAARRQAIIHRAAIEQGADPAAERTRARRTARTGERLDDLQAAYLKAAAKGLHGGRQVPRRASALEQDEMLYRVHIQPKFGARLYHTMTAGDVKELARELATEKELAAATVRGVIAVLRAILGFAVHEEKIAANPVIGVKLPKAAKRERMIDDGSLRKIWRALNDVDADEGNASLPLDPQAVRLLQLLILTSLRRAEVAGAAWAEFDLTAGLWTIPAHRMKGGRAHSVPLSDTAMDLLSRIRQSTDHLGSGYLFPMKGDPEKPVRPDRVTAEFAQMVKHLSLPAMSPHDVRRTCATLLTGRYAVPEKHISHVLAHSLTEGAAVTGQYNLHTYLPEKRAALGKWAGHLKSLLRDDGADNVHPIRRGA
jgi:integrase